MKPPYNRRVKGKTAPQNSQTMKDPDQAKIVQKLASIPPLYRGLYHLAMKGNSRRAAIKSFCLECMGWQREEVYKCTAVTCPLYRYRPTSTNAESPPESEP